MKDTSPLLNSQFEAIGFLIWQEIIVLQYTPQNNWRTNTINYNIDAFCEERFLKTNLTI